MTFESREAMTPSGDAPMSRVIQINPENDPRWDDFVEGRDDGTFYHSGAWQELIQRTYRFPSLHLAVENADGSLSGVLPLFLTGNALLGKKLMSTPFSDFGGPLATSSQALEMLIDRALQLRETHRAKYLQIRSTNTTLTQIDSRLTPDHRYVDFELRLSGDSLDKWNDPTWANIRTSIRKAAKEGVKVRLAESERDLREFYGLHLRTTKKHGMPAQSFGYFRNLWNIVRPERETRLWLASQDGRTIAASLFIAFGRRVSYVFNASEPTAVTIRPNYPLIWEAIKWACDGGYRQFSFGKTSQENEGLVMFKRGWGALPVPLSYYYYPKIGGTTSSAYGESTGMYQKITRVWRLLPAPVTNLVGGYMYGFLA